MVPDEHTTKSLWEKYHLPVAKRLHVTLVASVAIAFAKKIQNVNIPLLRAAALLHDIDKAIAKNPGEQHPDTAVRILKEEGLPEVAAVVATHSLHAILDSSIAPKTIEEKILYLADKMVKYEIIGVDKRFALWRSEDLPFEAIRILDRAYPKVKELEKGIAKLARVGYTYYI